jgi:2-oxoacid:acceptor oxidoreductase gamma subunit (pyruvate/2-ketoisovalerate family)
MPFLKEVRLHGRGGQGSVTAADIVAVSVINEGKYAQAFPVFGAERRGAPVTAFVRISDQKIDVREEVYSPDIVIVLDPALPRVVRVNEGLKEGGIVILNTKSSPDEARKIVDTKGKIATVDATKIALEELGVAVMNTSVLGAFAKATGMVKIESVLEAIKEHFPGTVGEKNAKAAERAYNEVKISG